MINIEDLNQYESAAWQCDAIYDFFEKLQDESVIINRWEGLFKLKKTDYTQLHNLANEFKPYNEMWNLAWNYFFD